MHGPLRLVRLYQLKDRFDLHRQDFHPTLHLLRQTETYLLALYYWVVRHCWNYRLKKFIGEKCTIIHSIKQTCYNSHLAIHYTNNLFLHTHHHFRYKNWSEWAVWCIEVFLLQCRFFKHNNTHWISYMFEVVCEMVSPGATTINNV